MKESLLSALKNDRSTCWRVTVPFSVVLSSSGTSARIPISYVVALMMYLCEKNVKLLEIG